MTTLDDVTQESVTAAEDLQARWEAGDLTDEQFIVLAAAVVLRANTRATVLADVTLARELADLVEETVVPLGLTLPAEESGRVTQALTTLAATGGSLARVTRLAGNEPLQAAAKARGEGMRRSPRVTGWTRTATGKSCKPCTDLADGTVLSPDATMWRHVGCDCTQTPITK